MYADFPIETHYHPFTGSNVHTFHIEDAEIAILTDLNAKIEGSHNLSSLLQPLHAHPYYELFFVEEGALRVRFDSGEVFLERNDFLVIAPGVEHLVLRGSENPLRYNMGFQFKPNALHTNGALYKALHAAFIAPYALLKNFPILQDTAKKLHASVINRQRMFMSLYFHEFAVQFLSSVALNTDCGVNKPLHLESDFVRLHHISGILNVEFANNITLEYVAKRLNLSVRQTSRIIKEYYKLPFSELILERKMRFAANQLIHSDLSIKEIARRSGYSSIVGFYDAFKKKYHCTPTQYREQQHSNATQAGAPIPD